MKRKMIRQGKKYSIKEALPDDPIYNRGFVVGVQRSKNLSKNTQGNFPHFVSRKPKT